ncbi:MAG: hypothetical protein ABSB25_08645 [Sedimentisphaerales bacterium]|jgi:hypothetical protein
MSNDIQETALLEPVAKYVRKKGYRFQESEVDFYDYRVDLYAFSRALKQTVAIELKVRDWRRAFEQAIIYQLCADHVYIAMPMESIARIDRIMLAKNDIGLIGVSIGRGCKQILKAGQSHVVREWYKEAFIKSLQERKKWLR